MYLLQLFLVCIVCNWARAYVYPLCSDLADHNCYNFLPSELFSMEKQEEKPVKEQEVENSIVNTITSYLGPFINYYVHNIEPFVAKIQFFPPLKIEVERKKAKWYHQLYVPMVIVGVITYLIIYIYITKKLSVFYKRQLKNSYVNLYKESRSARRR